MDIVKETLKLMKEYPSVYSKKATEKGIELLNYLGSMTCEQVCGLKDTVMKEKINDTVKSILIKFYEDNCANKGR